MTHMLKSVLIIDPKKKWLVLVNNKLLLNQNKMFMIMLIDYKSRLNYHRLNMNSI